MSRDTVATDASELMLTGAITSVTETHTGVTLALDAAPGAIVLTAMDAYDLPDGPGALHVDGDSDTTVGGEQLAYTAVDRDTGVINLDPATPLTYQHYMGAWFEYRPLQTTRYAWVRLDDDDQEPMVARVPATLDKALVTGAYDTPLPCQMRREGDEWVLTDLPGIIPAIANDQFVTAGLTVIDPVTGETVATIGPEGGSFQNLSAENFDSPGVPKRNERSVNLYVDALNGNDTNDGQGLPAITDTFTRSVAHPGWGTADSGHVWATHVNNGPIFDVNGTDGRIRLNGGSQETIASCGQPGSGVGFGPLDNEVLTRVRIDSRPTTGGFYAGVFGRIADSQNTICALLQITSAGALGLEINDQVNNAWTQQAVVSMGTFASDALIAAKDWFIRAQTQLNSEGGTDFRCKAWDASLAEPDDWMLTYNTTAAAGLQSAQRVGLGCRSGGAMTGNPIASFREFSAYCIDGSGLPVDVTVEGIGPLASVAAALEQLGEWNDGQIRIIMQGQIEENITIHGLGGGGSLVIDGGNAATLWGYVWCKNVTHDVRLAGFVLQDTGDTGPVASIYVYDSSYVYCQDLTIQSNGRTNSILFGQGSRGRVEGCGMHGATSRGLYSVNASTVFATENTGSGAPTSYQASCAIIFQSGTKPSNAAQTTLGGQIFGTTTTNQGGSAPTPNTKKTKTVTCNATKSWRSAYDPPWRSGDDPIQGSYAGSANSRGFFFYGTKCQVAGKTCQSIKVQMKRPSTGGGSGASNIYAWLHNYKTQSDAGNNGNLNEGPNMIGSLAWGQTKTFELPKAWGQQLLDGNRKGIAIYTGDGSPYVWLAARSNYDGTGKLTIVYT